MVQGPRQEGPSSLVQRYKKGLHKIGGIGCPKAVQSNQHQDRVGLLQGTKENGSQQMLPVLRFWPSGRPIRWHRQEQELLEVRRRGLRFFDRDRLSGSREKPQKEPSNII